MDRNLFVSTFEKDPFFDSFKQYWPEDITTSSEVVSNYFTRTQIKNMDKATVDIAIKYIFYNLILEGWAKNIKNKGLNKFWTLEDKKGIIWNCTLKAVLRPGHILAHSKESSWELRDIRLPSVLETKTDAICLIFILSHPLEGTKGLWTTSGPVLWLSWFSWDEFLDAIKIKSKNWLKLPVTLGAEAFSKYQKTLEVIPSQLSFQTIEGFMTPFVLKYIEKYRD